MPVLIMPRQFPNIALRIACSLYCANGIIVAPSSPPPWTSFSQASLPAGRTCRPRKPGGTIKPARVLSQSIANSLGRCDLNAVGAVENDRDRGEGHGAPGHRGPGPQARVL